MSLASVLLFPLAFLAPVVTAPAGQGGAGPAESWEVAALWPDVDEANDMRAPLSLRWPVVRHDGHEGDAWQVRIEQRMVIRIFPRGAMEGVEDTVHTSPERAQSYQERPMSNCLAASAIAGVQPERGNRLLLFLRDQRIVRAELERSCRAMDFYSGFYLTGPRDGRLCVNRDQLQARSGMKCGLTSLHLLVPAR